MSIDLINPLETVIREHIAQDGPISVAQYMSLCLAHPKYGYYMTRDPLGASGDFTTSPEISQMFGELIGLWAAETWRLAGSPDRLLLVELGPGRGTLMADALRAAKLAPSFREAIEVHLVEIGPALREAQREKLKNAGVRVEWHSTIDTLPDGAAIFLANEFLDALPVRQFQFQQGNWFERRIGVNENSKLAFGLSGQPLGLPVTKTVREGSILEICNPALSLVEKITRRLNDHGGAALFIDYGHLATGFGDTLQALKGHKTVPVLDEPGSADLTAHVDFGAIANAAAKSGATLYRGVTQAQFLNSLGIVRRADMLSRSAKVEAQKLNIEAGMKRLMDCKPDGMGALFKVLAFSDATISLLPGFEPVKSNQI